MKNVILLLVSALALPALAQEPAIDPNVTPTPTPEASPVSADPLAAPSPSPTPDAMPTPEATPEATPTPDATPAVAATPEATPAATPAPSPSPAPARGDDAPRWKGSPKWFSAELGAGGLQLEGGIATDVYDDRFEPAVHGRLGLLLFSIVDLGVSADFAQITGRRLGEGSGDASAEISRLTLVPLSANAILRLHIFPNQPLVPYAGAGYAYLVWSERNPIEDDQTDGDKSGVTLFGGVQILLDWLEPGRADDLDNWWGVNDTFLSLEVSRTTYGDSDDVTGLDLGHVEARASFLFEF